MLGSKTMISYGVHACSSVWIRLQLMVIMHELQSL